MDLDCKFPALSSAVDTALGLTLEDLSGRAPAIEYSYFDLERLCADVRLMAPHAASPIVGPQIAQARGYLKVLDEYLEQGLSKDPTDFVRKKLLAPSVPLRRPPSSEFLDTVTECQWGLFFLDEGFGVEEEVCFPGGGDADFKLTGAEELWVDCVSPEPSALREPLDGWLATRARRKWTGKFTSARGADQLPAAIALSIHKADKVIPAICLHTLTGSVLAPPSDLWSSCPGLRRVLVGIPPFTAASPRPSILCDWRRPT